MSTVTQIIGVTLICVLMISYAFTYDAAFWSRSYSVKLSMPILFALIIVCIFSETFYTYFEYTTTGIDPFAAAASSHYEPNRKRPRIRRKPKDEININYSTVNGLINIGCVHTSTSSMQKIFCHLQDVICAEQNEFSYFSDNKKDIYYQLFSNDPSDQLLFGSDMKALSEWNIDISKILKAYPYKDWLSHWDLAYTITRSSIRDYMHKYRSDDDNDKDSENHDMSDYMLYGKFTAHYVNPPTAIIFSYMAYHKRWKFTLHIREPINRLWSVQQHWHHYQGNGDEIRRAAANDVYQKYAKLPMLQELIDAIKDDSKSNDYIIGLYYKLYFTNLREIPDKKVDHRLLISDENENTESIDIKIKATTFEVTTSLYCVHVMFWLKNFEKYFYFKNISQYFKILQFENIIKDLSLTKKRIYCWYKENVNDIEDCTIQKLQEKHRRNFDNHVKKAGDHLWTVDMRWIDREKMMQLFIPCNKRLNKIIHQQPDLILDEWIDYNQMYEMEKQQNHTDEVVKRPSHRNGMYSDEKRKKIAEMTKAFNQRRKEYDGAGQIVASPLAKG